MISSPSPTDSNNSDKENDVTYDKSSTENVCPSATATRTPLSSVHINDDHPSAAPRLTLHQPPLNAPATVRPPPVVYQDLSDVNAAYIDDEPAAEEHRTPAPEVLPPTPAPYVNSNRIVLDANLTPVTPDFDTPKAAISNRKFASKCYVAEDVGDLQKNIQLNSLIIQKVEAMMTHKNKEYSDQLSLRDNTISTLEKEVQKLKDASSTKCQAPSRTTAKNMPAPQTKGAVKGSSLNRTWSLRISKKDRNEMNDKLATRPKVAAVAEKQTVNKKTMVDGSKTGATLPRAKKPDKTNATSTLPRRPNSAAATKTDAVKSSPRTLSATSTKSDTKTKSEKVKSVGIKNATNKKPVLPETNSAISRNHSNMSDKSEGANSKIGSSPARLNRENSHDASVEEGDSIHSRDSGLGIDPDFIAHLKRLTEEHEKLQIEYARLRVQMVESGSSISSPTTEVVEEEDKDLKVENRKLQNVLCGYKQEVARLQEELRRVQRKYWEQKLGSESIETELQCASKQVVDLIDKLDDATCELTAEKRKCADIVSQLSSHAKKNKKLNADFAESQQKVHELEQQIMDMNNVKQKLSTSIKDIEIEGKETQEFLMAERNAAAESLQEAESDLQSCRTELSKYHCLLSERNDQCRKLTEKLEQKELYLQMLQAELESTQNRARDMLLSQGAEITGASLALSEISHRIKAVIKSTIVSNNLNEEVVRKLLKANNLDSNDKKKIGVSGDVSFKAEMIEDMNNGNVLDTQNSSLIDSVLKAINEANSNNNRINNMGDCNGGECEPSEDVCDDNRGVPAAQRPIGFATPFHSKSSLKPIMEEEPISDKNGKDVWSDDASDTGSSTLNTLEDGTADVINQINSVKILVSKFAVISGMVQDNLSNKIQQIEVDKKLIEGNLAKEQSEKNATTTELKKKMSAMEMEISELRRHESLLVASKSKLTSLCECHEKTIKNLNKDMQELRMHNSCLEAEVREKRQQVTSALDKMAHMVSSSDSAYPGIQYISVSEALSEKFSLKGEIARLQGQLSENEKLLEEMASKFSRNKIVLEDNWQKAEAEVQRLDEIIDSVIHVFRRIPETIRETQLLSVLWSDLTGNEALQDGSHQTSADNASVTSGSNSMTA